MKSLILLVFLASSFTFAETRTIPITGMTCGGCVANIKKAVCKDLKFSRENCKVKIGELSVTADQIDMAAITAAIQEAGYEIATSSAAAAHDTTHAADGAPDKTKTSTVPAQKK